MKKILNAYKDFWLRGLDFVDYSTRFEFWVPTIINMIISFIIIFGFGIHSIHINLLSFDGILMYITLFIIAIPTLALQVRRLHDINRKGTLVTLSVFIAILYSILNGFSFIFLLLNIIQIIVSIWLFVYMFFKSKPHVKPENRTHI